MKRKSSDDDTLSSGNVFPKLFKLARATSNKVVSPGVEFPGWVFQAPEPEPIFHYNYQA
jgi:hypothetical protein